MANGGGNSDESRLDRIIEILAAIALSLATLLAAWSAFQSSKWGGVQSNDYASAGATRTQSTQLSTAAGQLATVDVTLFTQWLNAKASSDTDLASFYEKRFRDEFKTAFDAWLKTEPFINPDAPDTPFEMNEYVVQLAVEAKRLSGEADSLSASARKANSTGDRYVLMTVLFASVLFFAGISSKFKAPWSRTSMIIIAFTVLIASTIAVFTFPIQLN